VQWQKASPRRRERSPAQMHLTQAARSIRSSTPGRCGGHTSTTLRCESCCPSMQRATCAASRPCDMHGAWRFAELLTLVHATAGLVRRRPLLSICTNRSVAVHALLSGLSTCALFRWLDALVVVVTVADNPKGSQSKNTWGQTLRAVYTFSVSLPYYAVACLPIDAESPIVMRNSST
jgi:hypothetical protein